MMILHHQQALKKFLNFLVNRFNKKNIPTKELFTSFTYRYVESHFFRCYFKYDYLQL